MWVHLFFRNRLQKSVWQLYLLDCNIMLLLEIQLSMHYLQDCFFPSPETNLKKIGHIYYTMPKKSTVECAVMHYQPSTWTPWAKSWKKVWFLKIPNQNCFNYEKIGIVRMTSMIKLGLFDATFNVKSILFPLTFYVYLNFSVFLTFNQRK